MSDIAETIVGFKSPLTKTKYKLSQFLKDHNIETNLEEMTEREKVRLNLKLSSIETNYFHQLMRHNTYVSPETLSVVRSKPPNTNTSEMSESDIERYHEQLRDDLYIGGAENFHQFLQNPTYLLRRMNPIIGGNKNIENTILDKERYQVDKQLSAIKGIPDKRLWLKYFAATNAMKTISAYVQKDV